MKVLLFFIFSFCAFGKSERSIIEQLKKLNALEMKPETTCRISGELEPDQIRARGLSEWESELEENGIQSLSDLKNYFKNGKLPNGKNTDRYSRPRYLYSKKWGWIDLKHFTTAAHYAQKSRLPWLVLQKGEMVEKKQLKEKSYSAFSYEDLISNSLGSYFPYYLREQRKKSEKSDREILKDFFSEIGVVESPLSIAPNRDDIPKVEDVYTPPSATEYQYEPRFSDSSQTFNKTDKKIQAYIKKFKSWGSLIHNWGQDPRDDQKDD